VILSDVHPCDLDCTLQSRYHRLAIALELALKSHLIFCGASDEANCRDIGHDLGIAAKRAINTGLMITPVVLALIADVHRFFCAAVLHASGGPTGMSNVLSGQP
jgi:hypothetical protein